MRLLAASGGLWLVSLFAPLGCGGSGRNREQILARARGLDPDLECTDLAGLWPAEIETRTSNQYVPRSTTPLQYCFACANFQPGPTDRACGTCRTVRGPIDPGGWCKAWVARV